MNNVFLSEFDLNCLKKKEKVDISRVYKYFSDIDKKICFFFIKVLIFLVITNRRKMKGRKEDDILLLFRNICKSNILLFLIKLVQNVKDLGEYYFENQ